MTRILKTTALLLALVLLLSACGGTAKPTEPKDEQEALYAVLDEIMENIRPGTAGSTLSSVRTAAKLVKWASTTKMTKEEAASAVTQWLKTQSPELQQLFREKLTHVAESYGEILKDGAKDLLETAGVEDDLSNLGSRLKDLVETILEYRVSITEEGQ